MCVLLAACYPHDLVDRPKNDSDSQLASRRSVNESKPILAELGFSVDQISDTQHAILAYSFSADKPTETIEARILRDADRLDALCAVGIARNFSMAGA